MDGLRLYLDTSDLIMIGDGKADPAVVADLFQHCARLGVILLGSMWHVADCRNAPADARERIIGAIGQFPRFGFAKIAEAGLEIWESPPLAELLSNHGDVVRILDARANQAVALEQSVEPPNIGVAQFNLVRRLVLEVIPAATSRAEARALAKAFLHKHRRKVDVSLIPEMLTRIDTFWSMREQ
ncbi:MAG TPA: hypothetical protein VGM90_14185 [Kofleriaceae bacterium]